MSNMSNYFVSISFWMKLSFTRLNDLKYIILYAVVLV